MFDFLIGRIASAANGILALQVNDVGYALRITKFTFAQLDAQIGSNLQNEQLGVEEGKRVFFVHTQLLSEIGEIRLYGFLDRGDREMYRQLTTVSGIGPGTAMRIMDNIDPQSLRKAIAQRDGAKLYNIKGVGVKTAAKIIAELAL